MLNMVIAHGAQVVFVVMVLSVGWAIWPESIGERECDEVELEEITRRHG
jgi:hypothetical protein